MDAYLQTGLDALSDQTRMAIFQRLSSGPPAANEEAVVRKRVRLEVPIERAFSVFVEQMETCGRRATTLAEPRL